jgi:hypothetical protein
MPFELDKRFVRNAEEKLGATLPASYCSAMMAANGGELRGMAAGWNLYPIQDASDRKRQARTWSDIVEETRGLADAGSFPPGAVAIAQDGSGDQLVFLRAGAAFAPAVYHWHHETGELVKLADDFAALGRFVPKRRES